MLCGSKHNCTGGGKGFKGKVKVNTFLSYSNRNMKAAIFAVFKCILSPLKPQKTLLFTQMAANVKCTAVSKLMNSFEASLKTHE